MQSWTWHRTRISQIFPMSSWSGVTAQISPEPHNLKDGCTRRPALSLMFIHQWCSLTLAPMPDPCHQLPSLDGRVMSKASVCQPSVLISVPNSISTSRRKHIWITKRVTPCLITSVSDSQCNRYGYCYIYILLFSHIPYLVLLFTFIYRQTLHL